MFHEDTFPILTVFARLDQQQYCQKLLTD